jgi:microcystin-dependent protein
MARIPRIFQNQFGVNGPQSQFGQFGSRVSGPGTFTKDPNSIQSLSAFLQGWSSAINSANKAPFLEDMNGLCLLIFQQIAEILQDGIPPWDPSTVYFTGSVVQDGLGNLWKSPVDNNQGNALPAVGTSSGFWTFINAQSVPSGMVSPFAGASTSIPLGYLLCDGTAYTTAAQPNLFSAIGHTWDTFNGQSAPGGGSFRVPDLRSLTLIGAGQGGGFSSRTLAQLLGEETHTLGVGEIPAGLTVSDPGHHHVLPVAFAAGSFNFGSDGGSHNGIQGANSSLFNGIPAALTSSVGTGVTVGGGGGSHNNMQPSAGINWVIKT